MLFTAGLIAIGLSVFAGFLWVWPLDFPGPLDEILFTVLAVISWAWFGVLLWDKTKELLQNPAFLISLIIITAIIIIGFIIRSNVRRKK